MVRRQQPSIKCPYPEACADFEEIREAVAREVVAHEERDIARETDRKQRARLDQVRSTLSTMKAKNDPTPVLPNLSEFRKLPVVKIFEAGPSGAEKRTMKDPFVASVLEENLKQWREAAKAALAGVLGFPGWKMMSRRKLHPVDRLTARFRCKRCDKAALGKNRPDDGGMDFARVCEHVCKHLPKKRASSEKWSAERFELDQRVPVDPAYSSGTLLTTTVYVAGDRCDLAGARPVWDLCRGCGFYPDYGRSRGSCPVHVVFAHHERRKRCAYSGSRTLLASRSYRHLPGSTLQASYRMHLCSCGCSSQASHPAWAH